MAESIKNHRRITVAAVAATLSITCTALLMIWRSSGSARSNATRHSRNDPVIESGNIGNDASSHPNDTKLARLAHKYGVEVKTSSIYFPCKTSNGFIRGSMASRLELDSYVPLFIAEFTRYPVVLVAASRLRRIMIARCLTLSGNRRYAIADIGASTLYLDAAIPNTEESRTWLSDYRRHVLHHEFYHFIDWHDNLSFSYSPEWNDLNTPSFRYIGDALRRPDASYGISFRHKGFLTNYGRKSVAEDKAELFAMILCQPDIVTRRAAQDSILSSKVALLRELLLRFCPGAGEFVQWRYKPDRAVR